MRNKLLFLLLFASSSWGAVGNPTTDWQCSESPPATITLDAGSNRFVVLVSLNEVDGATPPDETVTSLGTVAPSQVLTPVVRTDPTNDMYWLGWAWSDAAIGTMSGNTLVSTDETTGNNLWCRAVVPGVDQGTTLIFTAPVYGAPVSSVDILTPNNAGDGVLTMGIKGTGEVGTYSIEWGLIKADMAPQFARDYGVGWGIGSGDSAQDVTTLSQNGTAGNFGGTAIVFPAAASLAFTVAPTLDDCNSTSCTFDFTPSAASTLYWSAYTTGATPPSDCDAVIAASGAEFSGSDAVTGADSVTITSVLIEQDYYFCLDDTSNQTAVEDVSDQQRDPASGMEFVDNAGLSATSAFAYPTDAACDSDGSTNVLTGCADTSDFQVGMAVTVSAGFPATGPYIIESLTVDSMTLEVVSDSAESNVTVTVPTFFDPAIAAGDLFEVDSATNHADTITWETDLDLSYTDTSGGAPTLIRYCIQDVSDASGEFTVPDCWSGGPEYLYLFYDRPEFDTTDFGTILLYEDEAMPTLFVSNYCTDPNGLSLTYAERSGDVPNGTAIAPDGEWTGTPDTPDETGVVLDLTCRNAAFLYGSPQSVDVYVTDDEVVFPDITGMTPEEAGPVILAVYPWMNTTLNIVVDGRVCSTTVDEDDIISSDPEASETTTAILPDVHVIVSAGETTPGCVVVFDMTGLPLSWEPVVDVLKNKHFVRIKQEECDGDGVWAQWRAGTAISPRGSSNCVLQTDIIRAEADGDADWARWAPGANHNSANLQLDVRAALTADFE